MFANRLRARYVFCAPRHMGFAPGAKEIDMMLETENGRGLCMTCNNAPTCFFRASRGPAMLCETFDDHRSPTVRTAVRTASPEAFRAAVDGSPAYVGLCMNCDGRRTCGHPRQVGGTWHCEDYT